MPDNANRAYGIVMVLCTDDVKALYSDASVADYVAETLSVVLPDGTVESAVCYNLSKRELEGANVAYARSLLALAAELGLPEEYLQQIKAQLT